MRSKDNSPFSSSTIGSSSFWASLRDLIWDLRERGNAMRKTILIMILAAVSHSAAAEWVLVDPSGFGNNVYANSATRRAGNRVKMWVLFNYRMAPTGIPESFKSIRGHGEYDCKEEASRWLDSSAHSGMMASGDVLAENILPEGWRSIAPGSEGELLWNFACAKR